MSTIVFADRNRVRIIVLLMIKNESRIIRRSIQSALSIADAICVSDTGSTDGTVELLQAFYPTLSVPCRTYTHPWTNFGINRSKSFNDAKQFCYELDWEPTKTYVLAIDADMELVVEPAFNKQTDLTLKGYSLIQKAGSLHYANMRLMRLDCPWKCVGATHEYWDGPMEGTIPDSKLWINDKNDGGCKADKYTRDLQMLQDELKEQPTNQRTHFYLAQTLKCLGKHDESIEFYKKRIELGGWYEEVWFSYYMIAQQYLNTGRPEEAELWTLKGQKYNNYRAESLYHLVKHFRIIGHQWKAMHYYYEAKRIPKPSVALFLESEIYDHLLDYEYTILQYYVNAADRKEGLRSSIKYLMKPESQPLLENVFSNLEFYVQPLPGTPTPMPFPSSDPFKPSSCSVTRLNDQLVMNARYVNYHTSNQGVYTAIDPENIVRTENMAITDLTKAPEIQFMTSDLPTFPTHILGLEDVRLFAYNNQLFYTAATKSSTPDTNYHIVLGNYDISNNQLMNSRILDHPIKKPCEKNWLLLDHNNKQTVLYNWSPLEILTVDPSSNILQPFRTHPTPPYFQKLRGSANPVLNNDKIWCLTHVVKHGTPRKYYHHFVILSKDTLKPELISTPFYFQTHGIEYCLGLDIQDNQATFYYSTWDADPRSLSVPLSAFEFIPV